MNELPIAAFLEAIWVTHGATGRHAGFERVVETFQDRIVWEGDVLIFELEGHPSSSRCYAWSVEGRVTAVLHEPLVDSPQAAVRVAQTAVADSE